MDLARIAIRKGIFASVLARAVLALGPLLLVPIFLQCLGKRDYGVWIIVLSITGYFGVVNFGLAQTVGVEISKGIAAGDSTHLSKILSTAWVLYWGIVVIAAAVGLAVSFLPLPAFKAVDLPDYFVFSLSLVFFMFALPLQLFGVALCAQQRVHEEQMAQVAGSAARYVAVALVLLSGGKLVAVAIAHGALGLLPGLLNFLRLRKVAVDLKLRWDSFDRRLAMLLVAPSAGYWVLQLSSILIFGLDSLIIGAFLGPEHVPSYAVPMQLIYGIQSIIGIASSVSMPTISMQFAQGNLANLRSLQRMLLDVSLLAGAFGVVVLWVLGPTLIPLWAGADVFPGTLAYVFMLAFFLIQASVYPSDALLQGSGRHLKYSMLCLGEGVINLALSIWWVQLWGLTGVIAATLCARLATVGWFLHWQAARMLEDTGYHFALTILQTVVMPLGAIAAVHGFWHLQPEAEPDLLLRAIVCFAVFVTAIFITKGKTMLEAARLLTH